MAESSKEASELEQIADSINPAFIATGMSIIGDVIVPGLGKVFGGLVTGTYAYRKLRSERNFKKFVEHLAKIHADDRRSIPGKWQALSNDRRQVFRERFFPTTADYVVDQKEEENVPFFAEALVSAIEDDGIEAAEYDDLSGLLAELRNIDIIVLCDYETGSHRSHAGHQQFLKELKITENQFARIQQRLFQRELLASDRDKQDKEFIKRLVDQFRALKDVVSDLESNWKTFRGQVLHYSLDRPSFDHISISELGSRLVKFANMRSLLDEKSDMNAD